MSQSDDLQFASRFDIELRTAPHPVTGHFHEGPGFVCGRPRGTPDWLLILSGEGLGQIDFCNGRLISGKGDLVLLTPGVQHRYGVEDSLQQWEFLWVHFYPRAHWQEWLNWPELGPGIHHIRLNAHAYEEIYPLFVEVHRLNSSALRRRDQFAMSQLERMLLSIDLYNPRSELAGFDPRIRRTMEYVCVDLSKPHRLADLAERVGMSVSRFAHLFHEQTNLTARQFVELQRLNRAKELLTYTQRTVQTIAADVGFENQFYFTLRFQKHTGQSPTQYRRSRDKARGHP